MNRFLNVELWNKSPLSVPFVFFWREYIPPVDIKCKNFERINFYIKCEQFYKNRIRHKRLFITVNPVENKDVKCTQIALRINSFEDSKRVILFATKQSWLTTIRKYGRWHVCTFLAQISRSISTRSQFKKFINYIFIILQITNSALIHLRLVVYFL